MYLPLSHDAAPTHRAASRRGRGGGFEASLIAVSLAVAFGLTPAALDIAAFGGRIAPALEAPVLRHLLLDCLAVFVVLVGAARLNGRLDQKLSGVVRRVLVAFGAVAFFTLITRHYYSIPMLIVGASLATVFGAAMMILRHKASRVRAGVIGPWPSLPPGVAGQCERIDSPERDIEPYDPLIIGSADALSGDWARLVAGALISGKRVRHAAEWVEELAGAVSIEHFDPADLPEGGFAAYRAGKRVLELTILVVTLPLTLPLLIFGVLAVLVGMGRPVFFIQERVGADGRVFRMTKLRTMETSADGGGGVATALRDRRITPLGRWLRRFHIDELPQLVNVLAGDMSLIGPRPEQPGLAAAYIAEMPAFAYRQLVRPGITGWAQVRAPYAADLAETRLKLGYDLFYLKYFSLGLDLRILGRTLIALIGGGGVR